MTLDDEILQLRANPVFALFEIEALRLIAFSSDTRSYRKDDVLFREGDVSDGGFFIVSGSVSLIGPDSTETHGSDALIGETALFADTKRPATANIVEPTVLRRIPRHLMRRVLAEFPETADRVHRHLNAKLTNLTERLSQVHALLHDDRV